MLKSLFVLAALALSAESVLACSPPPSAVYTQVPMLREIFDSEEVFSKILSLRAKSITSVTPSNRGYAIALDNGCTVTARVKWEAPASNGLCPRMAGVEIVEAICP